MTHIDDLLQDSGNIDFEERVMKKLKKKLVVGTEEEGHYICWNGGESSRRSDCSKSRSLFGSYNNSES